MDDLIIVALSQEFHLRHSALCIFKIVFFDPSDHLLECMVHDSYNEISLFFFERRQSDSDALHVIETRCTDQ